MQTHHPVPPFVPAADGPKNPEAMSGYEKEKHGVQETFDTESATFMDDEPGAVPQKKADKGN